MIFDIIPTLVCRHFYKRIQFPGTIADSPQTGKFCGHGGQDDWLEAPLPAEAEIFAYIKKGLRKMGHQKVGKNRGGWSWLISAVWSWKLGGYQLLSFVGAT